MTKRKFKFKVNLFVEELIAVPFVTDVLFCKIRLRNGGTYTNCTKHENVSNHSVFWEQKFQFTCKMSANPLTGVLDPCIIRISVRKEVKGGRSTSKVGFADLNLAEFAGFTQRKKHCLLEGYNSKIRLDNSILRVTIAMQLLSGDPLFKTPTSQKHVSLGLSADSSDICSVLTDSNSIDCGSLSKNSALKVIDEHDSSVGHSRNSSSVSHTSKWSDYSSHHSRTPSCCSHLSHCSKVKDKDATLVRSASSSTTFTRKYPLLRSSTSHANDIIHSRVSDTRVCANEIVTKLIESQDFSHSTQTNESDNLQLYVASDGSTALGGQNLNHRIESGLYHPVIFETKAKYHLKPEKLK